MSCVLLGDIGRPRLYHVGDEAMTDVAIAKLSQRGITEVTLAAVHPASASAEYGLPAVKQVGFTGTSTRQKLTELLTRCTDATTVAESPAAPLAAAIENADAVVIAGGGNLNSLYVQHLFERVTACRLAKLYGKPLLVTSQTIGPYLAEEDRPLLAEILAYATAFGTRDPHSFRLARELADAPERVTLTADDAIALPATLESLPFGLPERFVAASFSAGVETSGFDATSYRATVAGLLDTVAERLDADIVLVPHAASHQQDKPTADQRADAEVVSLSTSGRIMAAPRLPARVVTGVTAAATLSLSTRYHPTVFAPAHGVPAVGLAMSSYSVARMSGALGGFGLGDLVIAPENWDQVVEACDEAVRRADEVRAHTAERLTALSAQQNQWWDAIASAVRHEVAEWPAPLDDAPGLTMRGAWREQVLAGRERFGLVGPERERIRCLERDIATLTREQRERAAELRRLRAKAAADRERARVAEARRAVRIADGVGRAARTLFGRNR